MTWEVQRAVGEQFGFGHFDQLFYVGTIQVGPECIEVRPSEFTCGQAVPALADGDVIVSWAHTVGFGAGLGGRLPNLLVDGYDAVLEVADDPATYCEGADVAASLEVVTSDSTNESLIYCSRGIRQHEALAAFERFIGSIGIRLDDPEARSSAATNRG